jgi:8-oxo-dGTP diphosphatase
MTDAAGRHEQPAAAIRVTVAGPVTGPVTRERRDRGDREETGDGSYFAPLAKGRYLLLTTFKQKGTPVSAVVQGVADGDRAYFRVRNRSGTARRLRHTDGVQVAPCRALGLWSYGPPLDAAARPLAGEEAGRVARQLDRKYPVRHRSLAWPVHRAWRRRLAYYELLLRVTIASTPARARIPLMSIRRYYDWVFASSVRKTCAVAVDIVLLTVREGALQILLIDRGLSPQQGWPALPGGFVLDEDLPDAAERELKEETRIDPARLHLEQLQTFGAPSRDPRGRVISVAYLALAPGLPVPQAGTDATNARWEHAAAVLDGRVTLAFDHNAIVENGVERARSKLEYTTLATAFCQEEFTISELRRVYEIVWSTPVDARNFYRKVMSANFLVQTGRHTTRDGGRPAALFRLNEERASDLLYPAMLRPRLMARSLRVLRRAAARRTGRQTQRHTRPKNTYVMHDSL